MSIEVIVEGVIQQYKLMRKNLFLLIITILFTSCTTNYYTVLLTEDTTLYKNGDTLNFITSIPKKTHVYVSNKPKRKNFKKIKWGNYYGWAYNPNYISYSSYKTVSQPAYRTNYTPSSSKRSGGSVSVKGYYRKNGTYVKPHTRSAPRRR